MFRRLHCCGIGAESVSAVSGLLVRRLFDSAQLDHVQLSLSPNQMPYSVHIGGAWRTHSLYIRMCDDCRTSDWRHAYIFKCRRLSAVQGQAQVFT